MVIILLQEDSGWIDDPLVQDFKMLVQSCKEFKEKHTWGRGGNFLADFLPMIGFLTQNGGLGPNTFNQSLLGQGKYMHWVLYMIEVWS